MRLRTLVWRELFERRSQMLTSFLAILLGITTVVAIKNITFYSEKAVARELDTLGANVLVLPKSTTLQDYYAADMHDDVIPDAVLVAQRHPLITDRKPIVLLCIDALPWLHH